jgi:stress response protein YsnF
MTTPEQMRLLEGAQVFDAAGDPVGTVNAIYVDADTGEALWLRLSPGLFRTAPAVVPLRAAQLQPGKVRLAVDKQKIEAAPAPPALHLPLPRQLIDDLYRHFGLATADDDGADAMTRSEERLNVSTTPEVTGRVRLRTYVETEYVQVEVPVRRERVRVEQQPAAGTNDQGSPELADAEQPSAGEHDDPPQTSGDEAVVILHEERPVITTQTVPVERVRLSKQTVTGSETVRDHVRTEHIEAELPDTGSEPR